MEDRNVINIKFPEFPPMPQFEDFVKVGGKSEWLGELYLAALKSWEAVAITVSENQKEIIQATYAKNR